MHVCIQEDIYEAQILSCCRALWRLSRPFPCFWKPPFQPFPAIQADPLNLCKEYCYWKKNCWLCMFVYCANSSCNLRLGGQQSIFENMCQAPFSAALLAGLVE